ncbi:hypothetical protein BsWGS_02317 [Bradybaena similaris]
MYFIFASTRKHWRRLVHTEKLHYQTVYNVMRSYCSTTQQQLLIYPCSFMQEGRTYFWADVCHNCGMTLPGVCDKNPVFGLYPDSMTHTNAFGLILQRVYDRKTEIWDDTLSMKMVSIFGCIHEVSKKCFRSIDQYILLLFLLNSGVIIT